MGFLRVYLALCVIAAHAGPILPWRMHDGRQAVQMFYVLSGFYMALVLSTRYRRPTDFYRSRFLRIFAPYWVVLAGTLALCVLFGLGCGHWLLLAPYLDHPLEHNGPAGVLLAATSNLTLFGQDLVMFLRHDAGQSLRFTADFWSDAHPLWHYLVIPPAWSVGVELSFYLVAPWLCRLRVRWLVAIYLASLGARWIAASVFGLAHDPWNHRFFPFELGTFLLGALSYRLYEKLAAWPGSARLRCPGRLAWLGGIVVLLAGLTLHERAIGRLNQLVAPELAPLLTAPLLALVLPVLFLAFGNQRGDRLLGELSYPLYLVHFIVIAALRAMLGLAGFDAGLARLSAVLSVLAAVVIWRAVVVPTDRWRHRWGDEAPATGASAGPDRTSVAPARDFA